jgi:hypothetical protein
MKFAKCPECGNAYGPLVNQLMTHLRDQHGIRVARFNASSGACQYLKGVVPKHNQIEFVEVYE